MVTVIVLAEGVAPETQLTAKVTWADETVMFSELWLPGMVKNPKL